ncbi:Hypothetical protein NTJ_10299 [Nesidiocoris tenuis]|uniref:Uncharacterized protein n=1 Tax=Nesidiocoris tenuis TaxID=355587 RepID=A0ABN7B2S4_9HEMI|nr:Hypothetical protein NTJ_10299 [Nesidiocoris tenuis]
MQQGCSCSPSERRIFAATRSFITAAAGRSPAAFVIVIAGKTTPPNGTAHPSDSLDLFPRSIPKRPAYSGTRARQDFINRAVVPIVQLYQSGSFTKFSSSSSGRF